MTLDFMRRADIEEDWLVARQFVGQGSHDLSESIASQEQTRQMFLEGKCNVLLATSVADEGLDFPSCNAVILMDGADNDISLTQRLGRVRVDGQTVIFQRRDTEQKHEQLVMKSKREDEALRRLASKSNLPPRYSLPVAVENSAADAPSARDGRVAIPVNLEFRGTVELIQVCPFACIMSAYGEAHR